MENERMIYKNRYNIGIAIDTPEGLVVPVIRDADRLTIAELTQKITEYSLKARERKLTLDDPREGTLQLVTLDPSVVFSAHRSSTIHRQAYWALAVLWKTGKKRCIGHWQCIGLIDDCRSPDCRWWRNCSFCEMYHRLSIRSYFTYDGLNRILTADWTLFLFWMIETFSVQPARHTIARKRSKSIQHMDSGQGLHCVGASNNAPNALMTENVTADRVLVLKRPSRRTNSGSDPQTIVLAATVTDENNLKPKELFNKINGLIIKSIEGRWGYRTDFKRYLGHCHWRKKYLDRRCTDGKIHYSIMPY